jgi:hypothetical protein
VRLRGTPFIAAVVMSAAAMFLIPQAVKDVGGRDAPPPDSNALPAIGETADAAEASTPPQPSQPLPPAPTRAAAGTARTLRPGPVQLSVNGFSSWGLLDRRTGQLSGSATMAARSDTASMIKPWIAADYLRRAAEKRQTVDQGRQRALSTMIRDSVNEIASTYHRANGGTASITRMIKICGLAESRPVAVGSWSTTEVSARDAARLGVCIADGRAAGPQWTNWVLSEMRQVRGVGRFGIVSAFAPDVAGSVAIKNGWINRSDGKWHVACLAVSEDWVLAVLTRYPVPLGYTYGANVCKQVAVQLGSTG